MAMGNENDSKSDPTATIVDESDLSKSGKKLEHSSSSSSDNAGVSEDKPIEPSPVEKNKIETNKFDDMIRLDSSSSSESETNPAESSVPATFPAIDCPKAKPVDINIDTSPNEAESLGTSSFEKKPEAEAGEAVFSPRKALIYSFSASSSSSSNSDSSNEENFTKSSNNLASNLSDDDIPISSMPGEGQPPIQSPPMQVMERDEDPSSSPYRIPSHIFARNKSNTPAEWSTASNESLFSIHMGNTSFSRDQLCWLGKSGELCKPGEAIAPPAAELSSSQSPSFKPNEIAPKSADLAEEPVVTEATAAETMREVIRESAENRNQQNTVLAETVSRSANLSQRSDGSTKSFAFPILTGDGEKSISLKGGAEKQKQHFQSPPQSQPSSQPTTPKNSNSNAVPTSKSSKFGFNMRCFSCLSCCPFSFRK